MPEIREGALDTTVVDGKSIDPIFLSTTSNKLFEPIGIGESKSRIWLSHRIKRVQTEAELDEQYRKKADLLLRKQQ